jgi:hypothetical protein
MYVDMSFPPSKRDSVTFSQPTQGPQLRPQLNDFFELALDFLAACSRFHHDDLASRTPEQ